MSSAYLDPVRGLLSESLDLADPGEHDDLIESGSLDSLALIELLFQLEQRFGITLELDEIDPGALPDARLDRTARGRQGRAMIRPLRPDDSERSSPSTSALSEEAAHPLPGSRGTSGTRSSITPGTTRSSPRSSAWNRTGRSVG